MDFLHQVFHRKCVVKPSLSTENEQSLEESSQLRSLKRAVKAKDGARVQKLLAQIELRELNFADRGSLLWLAVARDHLEIASMLVDSGAEFTSRRPFNVLRPTLLHELVGSGDPRHHKLALLMIEQGADIEVWDGNRSTPLHHAIRSKSAGVHIIWELLRYGARVYRSHIVESANHPKAAKVMALVVGGFVDEDVRSHRIGDALYACTRVTTVNGNAVLPAVKMLLDMKLPVAKMVMGKWTLLRAIQSNMVGMVKLLIDYGLDVNEPENDSPLCAASKLEQSCITEMLLRAGAKVDSSIEDHEGYKRYAIHAACRNYSAENIRVLLRHGADINVWDSRGKTPFSMIELSDNIRVPHELVIRHFALLMSQGRRVNDLDLQRIEDHSEMHTYITQCLDELEKMRVMKMINNVPFIFIFQKYSVELMLVMKNSDIVENWTNEFPIYFEEMDFAFESVKAHSSLLIQKEKALCESLDKCLPYVPLEKIVYYMYLNDCKLINDVGVVYSNFMCLDFGESCFR